MRETGPIEALALAPSGWTGPESPLFPRPTLFRRPNSLDRRAQRGDGRGLPPCYWPMTLRQAADNLGAFCSKQL
jgi:hypothetical protein